MKEYGGFPMMGEKPFLEDSPAAYNIETEMAIEKPVDPFPTFRFLFHSRILRVVALGLAALGVAAGEVYYISQKINTVEEEKFYREAEKLRLRLEEFRKRKRDRPYQDEHRQNTPFPDEDNLEAEIDLG